MRDRSDAEDVAKVRKNLEPVYRDGGAGAKPATLDSALAKIKEAGKEGERR